MMKGVELRPATRDDTNAMLELLKSVCSEGDALPFVNGIDLRLIEEQWLGATGCVLAYTNNALLGMYRFGAAMPGRGAHISTATFLVDRDARGQGIGRALVAHCLVSARNAGFLAMQFNQVLSCNFAALTLYQSLGFEKVGCIPNAFHHAKLGYVSAYIMYRSLR